MTREEEWRREREVLRAERQDARLRWRSAADELAARARDPLGLGRFAGEHPVATAGIAALLAWAIRRHPSPWMSALKAAVPWLTSRLEAFLADRVSPPAS